MKLEDIIYALKMVVWYNGYDETIKGWIKLEPGEYGIICPLGIDTGPHTAQLQVLWMICVVLFGEYGVSPRFGGIHRVEDFRAFLGNLIDEADG